MKDFLILQYKEVSGCYHNTGTQNLNQQSCRERSIKILKLDTAFLKTRGIVIGTVQKIAIFHSRSRNTQKEYKLLLLKIFNLHKMIKNNQKRKKTGFQKKIKKIRKIVRIR